MPRQVMDDAGREMVQWKDMTGEERYRVVEMARRGEKPLKEICRSFGVSRQALSKAMEKVSRAAVEALEPKRPGRKAKTEQEQEISILSKRSSTLQKQVSHWKMRYEVAQTFLDLIREDEKKKGKPAKRAAPASGPATPVAPGGAGEGDGNPPPESAEVAEQE